MANAEDIARGLRHPRASDHTGSVADWMGADADLLQKTIAKASAKHGAIRFGYTRDGGAYSIGVYAGVDYFTDYVRPTESIDDYLRDLLTSFEEYTPEDGMQSQSQKRKVRK